MKNLSLTVMIVVLFQATVFAGKPDTGRVFGEMKGRVLATGSGRVMEFDSQGKTIWEYKGKNCHDIWKLESGNVLFADGEVKEVNPETNEIVFHFKSKATKGGGAFSCQRLKNGRTLIGENSTCRVLEVDKAGKILFSLQLKDYKEENHHNLRMVRKLDNGNYLACHSGKNLVREYTPKGDVVLELKTDELAFSAVRLKNGNTMVGHIGKVTEFDSKGNRVWEFTKKDVADIKLGKITGIHVQKDGTVVIGIYGANNTDQGAAVFAVNRKKEILWRYCGRNRAMMGVQLLDASGKSLTTSPLR
jgi:hypothetical protein